MTKAQACSRASERLRDSSWSMDPRPFSLEMLPSQEASTLPLCHGNSPGATEGRGGWGAGGSEQRPFVLGSQLGRARLRVACFSHAFPSHERSSPCSLSRQDHSADPFHFCGDTGEAKLTAAPASIRPLRYCLTPRPIMSLPQLEARRTQISFREVKEMGTRTMPSPRCYLHSTGKKNLRLAQKGNVLCC